MKRFKQPKKNKIQINQRQKDEIILTVKKKLYPLWVALFITAVKDTIGLTTEQTKSIISTANKYANHHNAGALDIHDFKENIEKDLGESLENLLRII